MHTGHIRNAMIISGVTGAALAGGMAALTPSIAAAEPTSAAADEKGQAEPEELPRGIKVSGAVRFTYLLKTWEGEDGNRARLGDIIFDTFELGADGYYGPFTVSGGYRFFQGYHMLHHGYLGYRASDSLQIDVGLVQAPFGILKFASHNWFFNLSYYVGMEDDYDYGVRATWLTGDLDLRMAFFKNSEGTFTGPSLDSTRYSYDVVRATEAELGYAGLVGNSNNTETNQVNARAAYAVRHGASLVTEAGASARVGGLYNDDTGEYGFHWAVAAHANGTYGPVSAHLQGIYYQFRPANPAGQSEDFVVMGAYAAPYLVAGEGVLLNADIAYTLPYTTRLISMIRIHENYSVLVKTDSGGPASHQNAIGAMIAIGPIYTFIDMVLGRHHPWLGPGAGYGAALTAGRLDEDGTEDTSWHGRFNINVGYYF